MVPIIIKDIQFIALEYFPTFSSAFFFLFLSCFVASSSLLLIIYTSVSLETFNFGPVSPDMHSIRKNFEHFYIRCGILGALENIKEINTLAFRKLYYNLRGKNSKSKYCVFLKVLGLIIYCRVINYLTFSSLKIYYLTGSEVRNSKAS